MTEYVCGFLFDSDCEFVVLIGKNRPDWQKGRLNGVGGHLENEESQYEGMTREFLEETGVNIPEEYWSLFAIITGKDFTCYFAKAFASYETVMSVKSMTDEKVRVFPVQNLPKEILPNLKWLIPMALDGEVSLSEISYK